MSASKITAKIDSTGRPHIFEVFDVVAVQGNDTTAQFVVVSHKALAQKGLSLIYQDTTRRDGVRMWVEGNVPMQVFKEAGFSVTFEDEVDVRGRELGSDTRVHLQAPAPIEV